MRIITSIIFVIIFIPQLGFGATVDATDCTKSALDTAIAAASTGDTITIKGGLACTSSWGTDKVTVPNDKKLIIQGGGADTTIITGTYGRDILDLGSAGTRLTGIGIKEGTIKVWGQGFRIDHCKIELTKWGTGIASYGVSGAIGSGVVDNNTIINASIKSCGSMSLLSEQAYQNVLWARDLNFGSGEAVYIEDNTFTSGTGKTNATDSNYGGATVFRYNTVSGLYLEAHSAGDQRGPRKWEYYGNSLTGEGTGGQPPFFVRGGTGFIFYNYAPGSWAGGDYVNLDNVRCYMATGAMGKCDGSNDGVDGSGANGYPCRDQIGRGPDSPQWVNSPPAAYTQAAVPAYIWNNKTETPTEVVPHIGNSCDAWIVNDRDYYAYNDSFVGTSGIGCGTLAARPATCTTGVGYWATAQSCSDLTGMVGASPATQISGTLYKCTSTNTWTAYYTPYAYPHPLRGETSNQTLTLTVNGSGTCTVTSFPSGISSTSSTTNDFEQNTEVTMTVAATSPNYFSGWSGTGGCTGTGSCVMTMSAAKAATATCSRYGTATIGSGGQITFGAGGSMTLQ